MTKFKKLVQTGVYQCVRKGNQTWALIERAERRRFYRGTPVRMKNNHSRQFASFSAGARALGVSEWKAKKLLEPITPETLPGERWESKPAVVELTGKQIWASSLGRLKLAGQLLNWHDHKPYKRIKINGKMHMWHRVVYAAWYGVNPKEGHMYVLHDDMVGKEADGYYRNYPSDLRLGTADENAQEFQASRKSTN